MRRLTLLSIVIASAGFADEQNATSIPETNNPHHVHAGVDTFWQHYSRKGQSLSKKTNGVLVGPRLSYEYVSPDSVYFGLEGVFAEGATTLRDHSRRDVFPRDKPVSHRTTIWGTAESRLGYTFQLKSSSITPFAGLGYTYWEQSTRKGAFTDWLYATAGVRFNNDISDNFDLGLNAKINYAFMVKNHTHDGNGTGSQFCGYEIGIPLTWHAKASNSWNVQLQPYFQSVSCQSVDIKSCLFNLGSRLDFVFRF